MSLVLRMKNDIKEFSIVVMENAKNVDIIGI